ncbi:MAG: type II and III secretion system protein family protein [Gammaproteobacteria bacterium]
MARFFAAIALPVQLAIFILLLIVMLSTAAFAQEVDRFSETRVSVPLFKSAVLDLSGPAARVSIGNPDVADILILRANQLYVLGKDLGTTNVILWDDRDNLVGNVSVEVTHDLENLKEKLSNLLPSEPIEVYSAQRSLVLRGTVSSLAAMQAAVDIADGYLAQIQTSTDTQQFEQEDQSQRADKSVGSVINMMQVGGAQQVMLEVKVAEIARQELKRLHAQFNAMGIGHGNWNLGGVNGGARFPDVEFEPFTFTDPDTGSVVQIPGGRRPVFDQDAPWGPAIDEFAPNPMSIENQGLWASFLTNSTLFNLAIDAAKENGLAKILAEPTLTTLTGEEAEFLSGGEFPIPVPQGNQGITVEFREFGVELKFLPVVLGSGNINVKLNIAVSELINSNSIGITSQDSTSSFVVPSLAKRSAIATVELQEGQTIAIAGLISENLREVVTKFPGLGEIPVLGALFRSQEFVNNESELVIIVTPHLAKPMKQEDVILPTDSFVEPTDAEFYFLGRMEGGRKPAASAGGATASADGDGDTPAEDEPAPALAEYGHQIQ